MTAHLPHPQTAKGEAKRRRELAAIHLGKKKLGLNDDLYREFLHQLTGKASAGDLTAAERAFVLDGMRRLGFKNDRLPDYDRRAQQLAAAAVADEQTHVVIRGLWAECHAVGAVRDPSPAALRAFVCRMAKVEALAWLSLDQAAKVIEGLKAMRDRAQGRG